MQRSGVLHRADSELLLGFSQRYQVEKTRERVGRTKATDAYHHFPAVLMRISHTLGGPERKNDDGCRNFGRKVVRTVGDRVVLTLHGAYAVPTVFCDLVAGLREKSGLAESPRREPKSNVVYSCFVLRPTFTNDSAFLSPAMILASKYILPRLFAAILLGLAPVMANAQNELGQDEGLPVVAWDEADQVLGRVSVVYGKIVNVGHTDHVHFLNFQQRDRKAFVAVVFTEAMEAFPDELESLYLNKLVRIRGTVSLFKGSPQIVVSNPEQIAVVEKLPESSIPRRPLIVLGDELIIGTYNIRNLFDDLDDPYHNDETTPAKPREDMHNVAGVIREFNPDVLALQEVENRGYLERFVGTMLPDMGYKHVVHIEGNDQRGIDCSVISRVPIGVVTSHRHRIFPSVNGGEQSFNRDLLCVELLPDGGTPFEMWVVHLKSNSGGREAAEPIRLGESGALHQIIVDRLARDPDAAFVLCGDFNDTFDSKTLTTILGSSNCLQPIFESIPDEQRITYNREPYRNMIDFMLCSPAMRQRYVDDSCKIRLGTDAASGSDHNPVYARFRKTALGGSAQSAQSAQSIGSDQPPYSALFGSAANVDSQVDADEMGPRGNIRPAEGVATSATWLLVACGGGLVAVMLLVTLVLRQR